MKVLKYLLQAAVALVVLNVWFFRFNQSTIYRGGEASNMIEEFAAYGLSENMVYLIGGLKILAALGLLIGLLKEKVVIPAALIMGTLMLGAIFMHFKVSDEAIKYLPAGLMFVFSVGIYLFPEKIEFIIVILCSFSCHLLLLKSSFYLFNSLIFFLMSLFHPKLLTTT